jgi:glycosyltransferase involved in cell wall biosynthesis
MASSEKVTFLHGGFARVGGIETFSADLLRALAARKVETELICWNSGGRNPNPALQELSRSGVKIARTNWRWGCRWGWPDRLMVARQWKRIAQAELLVFGKLLDRSAHRRLLPLRKRMILITPYRPAEMWQDWRPEEEILNSFQAIIVQAQRFEDELRQLGYRGEVFTLPYLPPGARDTSAWPENSLLRIGFLGRLVPDKNLEYLIDSFCCLRETNRRVQLHIFGDGPERNNLESLVGRLNLGTSVHFHGNQERSQVASAIDSCHFFAFSSTTEGQCMAALEILSRGRPVVGTPVGAFPEFLSGPLGAIAPLHDAAAFAAAMHMLARPIIAGEIVPDDVQRAYLTRFSRRKVIEGYLRVFGRPPASPRRAHAV